MPLQSREVITCRLIFDCDVECEQLETSNQALRDTSTILCLPSEARLQIWRYLLRLDWNREPHFRTVPAGSIAHLTRLDSRRILEAPQFRHKSKQEINGVLPTTHRCHLHPAILQTSSALYFEARTVLYIENKVFAVQCGISGLASRLRNYGIPTFGPIEPGLFRPREDKRSGQERTPSAHSQTEQVLFDPLVTFKGHKSKTGCPYYICSHKDGQNLLHALWIMIKCPFARSMRFSVHITSSHKYHSLSVTDKFVRGALLPWMHNHIDMLTMDDSTDQRLTTLSDSLVKHRNLSDKEANVYTYNTVCQFLEQVKDAADRAVEAGKYTMAETFYERICYEACSIVRTRTGKLVDVSNKTQDGINRVCKLIAVSAFRLCELRSGAIETFRTFKRAEASTPCASPRTEATEEQVLKASHMQKPGEPTPPIVRLAKLHGGVLPTKQQASKVAPEWPAPGTTRLSGKNALEHAIMSGLLALRLPCASPVAEWNIRLNLMLLFLFIQYDDLDKAAGCVSRLHHELLKLRNEAQQKNKTGGKWDDLKVLVDRLQAQMGIDRPARHKREDFRHLVEQTQDVVRKLWGERLTPKKGYTSLIWTFRWA